MKDATAQVSRRIRFYPRSYPIVDGMAAHAPAVEDDGWDGLLFTATQNLSMDVSRRCIWPPPSPVRQSVRAVRQARHDAWLAPENFDVGAFGALSGQRRWLDESGLDPPPHAGGTPVLRN